MFVNLRICPHYTSERVVGRGYPITAIVSILSTMLTDPDFTRTKALPDPTEPEPRSVVQTVVGTGAGGGVRWTDIDGGGTSTSSPLVVGGNGGVGLWGEGGERRSIKGASTTTVLLLLWGLYYGLDVA